MFDYVSFYLNRKYCVHYSADSPKASVIHLVANSSRVLIASRQFVSTITLLERSGVLDAIDYIVDICESYLKRELPVGYYREFNSESLYKTNYLVGMNPYGLTDIQEWQKFDIDINYNYTILRELWSILFEIYNLRKR